MLESAERANVIAVGNAHAKVCLNRFFAYHHRPDLAAKLAVIPYPVDECFLRGAVPRERQRRLVAVGRWDDPQKDAALLAAAVSRVLKARGSLSFVLVGRGGERVFGPLCARHPQVKYLGVQPPDAVAALLRDSRALLMSSRWKARLWSSTRRCAWVARLSGRAASSASGRFARAATSAHVPRRVAARAGRRGAGGDEGLGRRPARPAKDRRDLAAAVRPAHRVPSAPTAV